MRNGTSKSPLRPRPRDELLKARGTSCVRHDASAVFAAPLLRVGLLSRRSRGYRGLLGSALRAFHASSIRWENGKSKPSQLCWSQLLKLEAEFSRGSAAEPEPSPDTRSPPILAACRT